ncbi:MAG: hypothetical protein WCL39_11665 [Armatimonadota bacterium]
MTDMTEPLPTTPTATAADRAEEFLANATQFRLGSLLTESSHQRTVNLSKVAIKDPVEGLAVLLDVDKDIVVKYREWLKTGQLEEAASAVVSALQSGKKVLCTGCGATGRLSIQMDSIWRDFWQGRRAKGLLDPDPDVYENRMFSVMAGGDYALIKSVEGFEDFTQFGRAQIEDLGVEEGDVVFAITEGGETSFVIGTAWQGVDVGAKVFFVYNNPDELLREKVERSREIIDDPRITNINLTTGAMAITGSTRMQATSIQLCVMLTIWETVVQRLVGRERGNVFLHAINELTVGMRSGQFRREVAPLLEMEENTYRSGCKNTYFADRLAIDVLTDTTERSPTFCTPAFRKFDDTDASESWSFLYLPEEDTTAAWERLLKRAPRAVEWPRERLESLVGTEAAVKQHEIMHNITLGDIYRFKIGLDGQPYRPTQPGDCATAIVTAEEIDELMSVEGFYHRELHKAHQAGAKTGLIFLGDADTAALARTYMQDQLPETKGVFLKLPQIKSQIQFNERMAVKLLLNAISTCTMVRLGRVMGNVMIWVVPSNLKLIDRSTRYISQLAGVDYDVACRMLFEVIEYVSPRMKAGKAYPAPVGVSVMRLRYRISNEEAERKLRTELP